MSKRLGERDAKFAIKAGMAIAMLAAPAFIEPTRPIFVEYRGEWALVSVCIPSENVIYIIDATDSVLLFSHPRSEL
jgi:hypothetical protein